MGALDGWTAAPLLIALLGIVLVAIRARALLFRAALEAPLFLGALETRLSQGDRDSAARLAQGLRPAWAAELAARAIAVQDDPRELHFVLEETRAEYGAAAQRGLLAIRTLGRLAFPLALAVAIVELGRGFEPEPQLAMGKAALASQAISAGMLALSLGVITSLACQISVGVLTRAARQRLQELRSASDIFVARG